MAVLPKVDALPAPTARGPNQFNVSVGNMGSAIGRGVSALGQAIYEVQEEEDTLRAEDSYNQLLVQQMELEKGDNGFSNIKSHDLVSRPLYKEYDEKYQKIVDELSGKLSNEDQKKKFKRRADVARLQYRGKLIDHIQKEKDVYAEQVFTGGKAVELENAASNWSDPGVVKFSLERTTRLIDQQADRKGWPADVRKAEKQQATSDIHASVITQAVATDNPDYAREYYDKNKKHILGTDQPKLEDLIRKGGIKVTAQTFVDDIILRGVDEKKALADARKKFKGDEREAVVRAVENRFAEIDRLKVEKEKQASDDAWKIYAETRDFNAIPLNILEDMDGKEQENLRAYAEKVKAGAPVQTNYQVLEEILTMAKENPNEFKALQLYKFQPLLEEKHLDQLMKMKTERDEISYVSSQNEMRKRRLPEFKLDPKELGKDSKEGKAISILYDNIDQQVAAFQVAKGRKPDDQEFKNILDTMLMDQVYTEVGFPDPLKPVSSMTPEELEEAYIEVEGQEVFLNDVPAQTRIEIIQRLNRRGIPVTEKEIARSWLILTGNL